MVEPGRVDASAGILGQVEFIDATERLMCHVGQLHRGAERASDSRSVERAVVDGNDRAGPVDAFTFLLDQADAILATAGQHRRLGRARQQPVPRQTFGVQGARNVGGSVHRADGNPVAGSFLVQAPRESFARTGEVVSDAHHYVGARRRGRGRGLGGYLRSGARERLPREPARRFGLVAVGFWDRRRRARQRRVAKVIAVVIEQGDVGAAERDGVADGVKERDGADRLAAVLQTLAA